MTNTETQEKAEWSGMAKWSQAIDEVTANYTQRVNLLHGLFDVGSITPLEYAGRLVVMRHERDSALLKVAISLLKVR